MTVREMRARMTNREWLAWSSYYARREQERQLEEMKQERQLEEMKARRGS